MSDPTYGRWFDAKEVPVTDDANAWIVTAWRVIGDVYSGEPVTATRFRAFLPGAIHRHSEALGHPPVEMVEVWMRIPPPPWLDAKEAAKPCGHSADHCRHWQDWPMAEGQEEPYGDPGDGLGVQGVCCECGKSQWDE